MQLKTVAVALLAISLLPASVLLGCTSARDSTSARPGTTDTSTAGKNAQPPNGSVRVLTTITIFADLIHQVGQDRVVVKNIVPNGSDPHTFQPTPQDLREISESRIAFVNGLGLEGPIESVIRNASKQGPRVVILSEGLAPLAQEHEEEAEDSGDEDEHSEGNPHLWLDARLAAQYVRRIQKELATTDPASAALYERNAEKYLVQLAELDAWIEKEVGNIPREKRKLVTFHDAFPYYANRYGLELVGVVLRSPGREPSAREVTALVERIKREGVRTVFAEPQLNARVLEVVAKEAGVKLATLYSDSTDDRITSYISLMRYNTEQIVNGLR